MREKRGAETGVRDFERGGGGRRWAEVGGGEIEEVGGGKAGGGGCFGRERAKYIIILVEWRRRRKEARERRRRRWKVQFLERCLAMERPIFPNPRNDTKTFRSAIVTDLKIKSENDDESTLDGFTPRGEAIRTFPY